MTKIKKMLVVLVFGLALAIPAAAMAQQDPNKKPDSCCDIQDCCKDKSNKDMACCKDKDCCKDGACAKNAKDGSCCCSGDSCQMKHDKKDGKDKP